MKIVVATPLYPPEIGGPATYAKLLEEGLPARGIAVALVKFSDVRHLPKLIRHIAYFFRVWSAAKGADAILALDPVSVGVPVAKAAWLRGVPLVVKVVGDYAWEQGRQRFGITADLDTFIDMERVPLPVRLLRAVQKSVARSANTIIVPSAYLKGIVVRGWRIVEAKVEVIYNAVEAGSVGVRPESVAQLRKPYVVTVGRLVPWKRFDAVIDAVAKVPKFSLVIVGSGPLHDELSVQAQEKLGENCVMTGQLSHADTLAVMRDAAVLVLNSTYEGLSHVLIEAQSLGVPAIVTDAGGNPEIVTNNKNGLVLPVGDPLALQNALGDFAHFDHSYMREHARENAKRFSKDDMLDAVTTLFKRL